MTRPRPYYNGLEDLDPECRELAEALNDLPGITTLGCCSGHGRAPFFMSLTAETQDDIVTVAHLLDNEPEYRFEWRLEVRYQSPSCEHPSPRVYYALIGPRGKGGDVLARALRRVDLDCTVCGDWPRRAGLIADWHKAGDQCPCCGLPDRDCDGTLVMSIP